MTQPGGRAHRTDPDRATTWIALGVLIVVFAVLIWSRFSLLGLSIWRDEAYSAVRYIDQGPKEIFFGFYVPNNHVLYSLLAWITTEIAGRGEAVYRFWSVVPATVAVALVTWWSWRRVSRLAAVTVALLAMGSPLHLNLAPQARGYGLVILAGAGVLVFAMRATDGGRTRDIALFGAFGAVGIWTIPVFVLVFLAEAAVLLVLRPLRTRVLLAVGAVGAASFVLYLPLLTDLLDNADQKFGEQLPWYGVIDGPFNHLGYPTLAGLVPNRPDFVSSEPVMAILFLGLVALAAWRCWRRDERFLLANLVVPIVAVYIALTIGRFYVEARFVSFLLFHVIVLISLGVVEAWELVSSRRVPRTALAAVALLAAVCIIGVGVVNTFFDSRRARNPLENYLGAVQIVRGSGVRDVITNSDRPEGLFFYLGDERVERMIPEELEQRFCDPDARFVYIDHNLEHTPEADTTCLEERGAIPIRVEQRSRGSFDVWLLPGNGPLP